MEANPSLNPLPNPNPNRNPDPDPDPNPEPDPTPTPTPTPDPDPNQVSSNDDTSMYDKYADSVEESGPLINSTKDAELFHNF